MYQIRIRNVRDEGRATLFFWDSNERKDRLRSEVYPMLRRRQNVNSLPCHDYCHFRQFPEYIANPLIIDKYRLAFLHRLEVLPLRL